jgi:hypothetical protein
MRLDANTINAQPTGAMIALTEMVIQSSVALAAGTTPLKIAKAQALRIATLCSTLAPVNSRYSVRFHLTLHGCIL